MLAHILHNRATLFARGGSGLITLPYGTIVFVAKMGKGKAIVIYDEVIYTVAPQVLHPIETEADVLTKKQATLLLSEREQARQKSIEDQINNLEFDE